MMKDNCDSDHVKKSQNALVINYLTMRRAIGTMGLLFPLVVVALDALMMTHDFVLRPTISAYYYSDLGSVFIGILFTIGFFLIAYKGYDDMDNWVANIAGGSALGVAIFPTCSDSGETIYLPCICHIHGIFTGIFFLAIIYMCFVQFTKTNNCGDDTYKKEKARRNMWYRVFAAIMGTMVILIGLYYFLKFMDAPFVEGLKEYKIVFFMESIAVMTFGLAWLLKGIALQPASGEQNEEVRASAQLSRPG